MLVKLDEYCVLVDFATVVVWWVSTDFGRNTASFMRVEVGITVCHASKPMILTCLGVGNVLKTL
jgi:hypothetical protein